MFKEILENNQFFGPLGSITLSGSWPKMEPMGRNFLQLLQYMLSSAVAPRVKRGGGVGGIISRDENVHKHSCFSRNHDFIIRSN